MGRESEYGEGEKSIGILASNQRARSVPYLFNLLMDTLEKVDQESPMWGATGRKFLVSKMWTMNTAAGFIGEHLKSLAEYPPSQGGDTLSMRKVLEEFMKKLEKNAAGNQ